MLRLTCLILHRKIVDFSQHTNGIDFDASIHDGPTVRNYSMRDLLEIELWPEYSSAYHRSAGLKQPIRGLDSLACYFCRRIRYAGKVSNAMMESKRRK